MCVYFKGGIDYESRFEKTLSVLIPREGITADHSERGNRIEQHSKEGSYRIQLFIQDCLDTSSLRTVTGSRRDATVLAYSKAQSEMHSHGCTNSYVSYYSIGYSFRVP